jgi:HAD superfamily hydrolase (TIGR01509 family)
MALQAVIFDVDGTLVESERHGHRVAFNDAFAEHGLPYRWDQELYGELLAITGGKERLTAYLVSQGRTPDEARHLAVELHAAKNRRFLELVARKALPARPGTTELLDELARAGVRLAVATTGSRAWVEPLLDDLFGLERFEVMVAGDDVTAKKPDPSAYLMALEQLGLGAADVLAVEDSVTGLKAARAAGLTCVVVVNDYTRDGDYRDAVLVADSFEAPRLLRDPLGVGPLPRIDADVLIKVHDAAAQQRARR